MVAVWSAQLLVACQPDPAGTIQVHGGVGQAWLITAPHVPIGLFHDGKQVPTVQLGANGQPQMVPSQMTDSSGALVLRYVTPGTGYTVRRLDSNDDGSLGFSTFRVLNLTENPPQSFYANQHIGDGYGYLTTRDGTNLSINVQLPGPADKGPCRAVVEYSGHGQPARTPTSPR